MQTEFRTILWRRGLSMMLFVLFSMTVAMAQGAGAREGYCD